MSVATSPRPDTKIQLFDCRLTETALTTLAVPLRLGQLAAGPAGGQLEDVIAARFPGRYAVAVSDMTHALVMALRLAGVRRGDQVLSLAFNCMSSNAAIGMIGADVAWVDVDPATATFDVDQARSRLTTRTKAVVVYHISGYPADLAQLRAFCDAHGLPLIEDANNAFGASVDGQPVGMLGDFSIFSLYANRQLNGIDGGILLCARPEDAAHARRLRRFGIDVARFRDVDGEIDPMLDIPEIGTSASLDNIHATLALDSITDVDDRIARSRRNAALLAGATSSLPIVPIAVLPGAEPVYWTWLIRLNERDTVMRALKKRGIMCSKLHYPNHHYTGFRTTPGESVQELPGTTTLQEEMLAIPCGWWIDDAAVAAIAVAIGEAVQARP